MIRRRVTALVAALAITLVLPSSAAWAGKPGHSAPVVTVLNRHRPRGPWIGKHHRS